MRVDQIFPSKFLKASEVGNQSFALTISTVALEDVGDKDGQKPVIYFQGAEKGMILNRTNGATLEWLYGPETDGWIGKQIVLFTEMTQYKGQPMLGMRFRGPAAAAPVTGGLPGGHPAPDAPLPSSPQRGPGEQATAQALGTARVMETHPDDLDDEIPFS